MKGSKLFAETVQSLFGDEARTEEERISGRSKEKIMERNMHLMYRYHYYATFTEKRWDIVVVLLANEFYLEEKTVSNIIQEHAVLRRQLMNEKPTLGEMRKKYPFFSW